MAISNSVNSNSWKQDNGTYRYFTLGWSIIDTNYTTRQYKVRAYIDFAGNNYQWVQNECKLYLFSNDSWVNVASAARARTYNGRRCYYEFWLSANDDGVAWCSLKMEGSIYYKAWYHSASLTDQSVSGDISKVTSAPSLSSISISSDFRSISASCSITSNGKNGSLNASISEFKAYLYENDYKHIATANVNSGETITWTSLDWENFGIYPDTLYGVTFLVKNNAGKEASEYTTIYTEPYYNSSPPTNLNISYSPNSEEPTIVSSYTFNWGPPSNWGTDAPDDTFGYELIILVLASNNKYYVISEYGREEFSSNLNSRFVYIDSSRDIPNISYNLPNYIIKNIMPEDKLFFRIRTRLTYMRANYYSSYVDSISLFINDDQAKVKLLDHDYQPVTGKVWVKDETGTWRKAKKIYVDTGTTSKNWEKSTNPTL